MQYLAIKGLIYFLYIKILILQVTIITLQPRPSINKFSLWISTDRFPIRPCGLVRLKRLSSKQEILGSNPSRAFWKMNPHYIFFPFRIFQSFQSLLKTVNCFSIKWSFLRCRLSIFPKMVEFVVKPVFEPHLLSAPVTTRWVRRCHRDGLVKLANEVAGR